MRAEHYVGLMSGTSLDGIDAVTVSFEGDRLSVTGHAEHPFPPELRQELLDLNQAGGQDELERAATAGVALARCYAQASLAAVAAAGLQPADIAAIGCHGQTVRHRPERGYTLQLGNGAWLAELTGILVVTDFRSRDLAAGGQGAPLVPAFHEAVFASPDTARALLNLGGISNLTLLRPGEPARGYDCGPGNVLMDGWAERHLGQPFDRDGAWARTGRVDPALLETLLTHPHFRRTPPKSTGRDEFHLQWLEHHDCVRQLPPQDVQATLLALTARAAADCIAAEADGASLEIFCCGGGARNGALMSALQDLLPGLPVASTDVLGLPVQWVEAAAFAWLARELLQGRHASRPHVTGARHSVPLGAIYPA
ncbi:MAG: anhydro-N-acetylmuramic acid kinase [Betaproteobacteria bacterium]|nr:anhydro-N-acetylmuramic acid kinase [Betaproteobacteria bacterium]